MFLKLHLIYKTPKPKINKIEKIKSNNKIQYNQSENTLIFCFISWIPLSTKINKRNIGEEINGPIIIASKINMIQNHHFFNKFI